jgi:hypothetical protein
MKHTKLPDDFAERSLSELYLYALIELRDMRDFVLQMSAPKRISGEYGHSREEIEVKAKALLDKYDL